MSRDYWRVLRFLGVGVLNTGFGYASYAAFVLAGASLWLAVSGSTILAFLFNFLSYGGLVFGSTSHQLLPRFLVFYTGLGILNFALLRLLTWLGLGLLLAQAVLLPILALTGYFAMRSFVFVTSGAPQANQSDMIHSPIIEEFKPIPVRLSAGPMARALFVLRMAVDLQLLTCTRFLMPHLAHIAGNVLDVGCGEMPFRRLLGSDVRYTGIDVPEAVDFGMHRHPDILPFDGGHIPFPDGSFDHVMCVEVLEHAMDPTGLVGEMRRVLRPGGTLIATVPFAARVHHAPHDFHRFTRFRLAAIFADFSGTEIQERGDDLAVIANKLIVVCARLTRPRPFFTLPLRILLLALLVPIAAVALGIAHLSLIFGWGSRTDPLGYGILARRN